MSLSDDLQEIDGIGPAKAEEIMGVLDGYDTTEDPYIQKARDAARAGDDREAAIFLRRAGGE